MKNTTTSEVVRVPVNTVAHVSLSQQGEMFYAYILAAGDVAAAGSAGRGVQFRAKSKEVAIRAALQSVGMSVLKRR